MTWEPVSAVGDSPPLKSIAGKYDRLLANDGTGAIGDLVVCYDPVGSQTASDMVPLTQHDFSVTPDGSDVTAQIAATGFFRAT